jgi:nucleotidyltransferase substrate binding protein (TIGR01987 family)
VAWNTLKDFIESRGATKIYGSKDATREAFSRGLIMNGDEWMAMIQSRNRSTHTYSEKTAKELAEAILSSFMAEFEMFVVTFTDLEAQEP